MLPSSYLPPNANFRRSRRFNKLVDKAERAVNQLWVREME